MNKYVIVTPARDEAAHIQHTIDALSAQTVRPAQWIIVDDGSRDGTGEIVDRAASLHDWITVVHRANQNAESLTLERLELLDVEQEPAVAFEEHDLAVLALPARRRDPERI